MTCQACESFEEGDVVVCRAAFTNPSGGAALDPSVVKFRFKTPAGVVTTYTHGVDDEIVKDSTGNYHVNLNANEGGTWKARFWSTGTGQAAEQVSFQVTAAI
jgi:hypothetical protein